MTRLKQFPAIDYFRLIASVFVIAIHTGPLSSYWNAGNFWITRVLGRLAVPFFFMTTGYFLAQKQWRNGKSLWKKFLILYVISSLIYLPCNLYLGNFHSASTLQAIFFDGTFYHLWYFPAVLLGIPLSIQLSKLGLRAALPIAAVLYLIGLGGDSYWGGTSQTSSLTCFYHVLFNFFTYTRNGLFFAPLFLLLGAWGWSRSVRWSSAGFLVCLLGMTCEASFLHTLGYPRHDSMYLFLPLCMLCLFSLLLRANSGEQVRIRKATVWIYILHPGCILLIRAVAKYWNLQSLMVENSLLYFFLTCALSFLLSFLIILRPWPAPCPTQRAWKEINLPALCHNAFVLQAQLHPQCQLMAVLKADAYGHGMVPIARALQKSGIQAFAVACLKEAIALRKAGIRGTILILGYTPASQARELARWKITQSLVDESHALLLSAQKHKIHVHLALDTGMHRLGVPAEAYEAISRIYTLPNLQVDGIFTHLCAVESKKTDHIVYTQKQIDAFFCTIEKLRTNGIHPGKIHFQASYGILNLPAYPTQYARAGIALYGIYSNSEPVQKKLDLWPVLSLKARISTVRTLNPGEFAGYGCEFQAQAPTTLAVATIGYADGLPRNFSKTGNYVLLHGQRANVIGQLCMDQMLLDVTGINQVVPGDIITIVGRDAGRMICAETVAEKCGTITNELFSRLGNRLDTVWISQ